MIIIADAGSTKIEWALVDRQKNIVLRLHTRGFNAAINSAPILEDTLKTEASHLIEQGKDCSCVWYYGAGCTSERRKNVINILSKIFTPRQCHVESDMLAAARALCGNKAGIACILGTGSNSCLYDGKTIIDNVPPLGFIIGDEGSGAVLGRTLIEHIFKGRFSKRVTRLFHSCYPQLDTAEIITKVYRGEKPGAYLASFAPFLYENIADPEIDRFVTDELIRFFKFNVLAYDGAHSLPVNFAGSIAHYFAPQLHKAAFECNCRIGKIAQAPMDDLIRFHSEMPAKM